MRIRFASEVHNVLKIQTFLLLMYILKCKRLSIALTAIPLLPFNQGRSFQFVNFKPIIIIYLYSVQSGNNLRWDTFRNIMIYYIIYVSHLKLLPDWTLYKYNVRIKPSTNCGYEMVRIGPMSGSN